MQLTFGANGLNVVTDNECARLLDLSLEVLEKNGVAVENETLRKRFVEAGAKTGLKDERVFFPREYVESHLNRVTKHPKTDTEGKQSRFRAVAEIYHGLWLDPEDNILKPWTMKNWKEYVRLSKQLPNIDGASMLGCPMTEIPLSKQPLYEKLYCWKYGVAGGDGIWTSEFCSPILEMAEVWADACKSELSEVFRGTVYLISPLRFGYVEAEQYVWFHQHGLKVHVGWNGALGAGLPVTVAGGLVVQIAEALFVSMLQEIHFGSSPLYLESSISVIDMRTGAQQYGRPEKSIANLAMAAFARWIGAAFSGHCGLADAKAPGAEAAMQKTTSALLNIAVGGNGHIAAGLLGTDEIFSPIQMILDNELTGSLLHIARGLDMDDDASVLESILEEGPGGCFLGTEHTASHFREALWQPDIWSTSMTGAWMQAGGKHDVDRALDRYRQLLHEPGELPVLMDEKTEARLMKIIGSSKR